MFYPQFGGKEPTFLQHFLSPIIGGLYYLAITSRLNVYEIKR